MMFRLLTNMVATRLLLAHEGHGHGAPGTGGTWWHYLTEPEHAVVTWGTGLALLVIFYLAIRLIVNARLTSQSEPERVSSDKIGR